MAFTLTSNKGTGTAAAIALGTMTAGDLMVVAAANFTGNETISGTPTDSLGNTYNVGEVYSSSGNTLAVLWGIIGTGGSGATLTITWSAGSTVSSAYGEFSGSSVTGCSQDGSGQGVNVTTGTTLTTPSITTIGADDLVVNAIYQDGGVATFNSPWSSAASQSYGVSLAYQADVAAGTYSPNITITTGNNYSAVVAIKAGSSGGATATTFSVSDPGATRIPGIH